jgi:hypothetical protein
VILSTASDLGHWGRIVHGVRLSSLRRVPSVAESVSAVAGPGNAGARPAREPFELAAGIEVAVDRPRALLGC